MKPIQEILAEVLYSAYCESVGDKAFNGDPLPMWHEFRADPKKRQQSEAWVAAATKGLRFLGLTQE